jgi:hypothetical protein
MRWRPPWRYGAETAPCSECGDDVVASTRDGFERCRQCHAEAIRRGRGEEPCRCGLCRSCVYGVRELLVGADLGRPGDATALTLWEADPHA